MKDLFSLSGKVALVTGGSRGIGRMICEGLLACGARVYHSSRDAASATRTTQELSALGDIVDLSADLGSMEGVSRLAAAVEEREPALHILVNNAGAVWSAPFETYPESGWDKVSHLNVKSPFFLTQALLPALRRAVRPGDPARIINVTSIDAFHVPLTDTFAYSAAKAGMTILTRMLASRLGPEGMTVNAIAPGMFPTRMTAGVLESEGQRFLDKVPLGRFGTTDDMAGVAVFLASRAGAYVSGTTIAVDGGWLGAT